jgi:hypothetical protein
MGTKQQKPQLLMKYVRGQRYQKPLLMKVNTFCPFQNWKNVEFERDLIDYMQMGSQIM